MIGLLAAITIAAGPQAALQISEGSRARVESCQNRQAGTFILLGKLDRPDTDRAAAAAEARATQQECNTAALDLAGDSWAAPCGRLMVLTAAHAAVLEQVYLDHQPRTELPSLIYPDSVGDGYRCLQIIEGKQP